MFSFTSARRAIVAVVLFSAVMARSKQQPQVLLAVFAHPDDESVVAPVLARYARQGVKVYMAIATDGERGVRDHAHIPAGLQLAAAREKEAVCSCKQLGIEPPLFFHVPDGELGAITSVPGSNAQIVADKTRQLVAKLSPDVVVTWGPDGGYGHPDHRLVSAAVTQVIGERTKPLQLFYVGFSNTAVPYLNGKGGIAWNTGLVFDGTDARYLPVRISFDASDAEAADRALECHKSQFTTEEMNSLERSLKAAWGGEVSFRPWFGSRKSKDLFR